jgi:hypothetical protein
MQPHNIPITISSLHHQHLQLLSLSLSNEIENVVLGANNML